MRLRSKTFKLDNNLISSAARRTPKLYTVHYKLYTASRPAAFCKITTFGSVLFVPDPKHQPKRFRKHLWYPLRGYYLDCFKSIGARAKPVRLRSKTFKLDNNLISSAARRTPKLYTVHYKLYTASRPAAFCKITTFGSVLFVPDPKHQPKRFRKHFRTLDNNNFHKNAPLTSSAKISPEQ